MVPLIGNIEKINDYGYSIELKNRANDYVYEICKITTKGKFYMHTSLNGDVQIYSHKNFYENL